MVGQYGTRGDLEEAAIYNRSYSTIHSRYLPTWYLTGYPDIPSSHPALSTPLSSLLNLAGLVHLPLQHTIYYLVLQ
jgi:hypothetical protein